MGLLADQTPATTATGDAGCTKAGVKGGGKGPPHCPMATGVASPATRFQRMW